MVLPETTIFRLQTKTHMAGAFWLKRFTRKKTHACQIKNGGKPFCNAYDSLTESSGEYYIHQQITENWLVQSESIPPTHVSQHVKCETSPRTRQKCRSGIARTEVSLQPPFQVPPVKEINTKLRHV